jgi:hypothetical protein
VKHPVLYDLSTQQFLRPRAAFLPRPSRTFFRRNTPKHPFEQMGNAPGSFKMLRQTLRRSEWFAEVAVILPEAVRDRIGART